LLVHGFWGRLTGATLIAVPASVFGVLVVQGRDLWRDVSLYAILALPSLVAAFVVHELGHYLALRALGQKARIVWRFPMDMRTLPCSTGVWGADSPSLVVRGLAGFGVNAFLWVVLVCISLLSGQPVLAFLAVWQGISALAATVWSAYRPLTDASTLRRALAVSDAVEMKGCKEGCQSAVIRVTAVQTPRWSTSAPYWVLIRGMVDPGIVAEPNGLVFSTGCGETVVVFPEEAVGVCHIVAHGESKSGQVSCVTSCGSRVSVEL
jgi:hypothetical protein